MHICQIHIRNKTPTYRLPGTFSAALTGSQGPSQQHLHAATRDNVRGMINRIHGILKNRERKIIRARKLEF